ncbi:MAG: hypothetical protein ABFD12_14665 [Syntrophorhabdus sp.]
MNSPDEMQERIEAIKQQDEPLAITFLSALNDAADNPKKAMLECGYILETILSVIINKQGVELKFVWSMVDIASSAEKIELDDIQSVLDNLLYITEWFQTSEYSRGSGDEKDSQEPEILPQLKAQYKQYLKPDIVSVKFRQTDSACFSELPGKKTSVSSQEVRDLFPNSSSSPRGTCTRISGHRSTISG